MSIQTEIDRINGNVAASYAAAEELGADLPAEQNSDNLPETIRAIPTAEIVQETGSSETAIMSQAAVTRELNKQSEEIEELKAGGGDTSLDASDIKSGTLSSDRLPTVPIAKGGTDATNRANAIFNLTAGGTSNGDLNTKTDAGFYWISTASCTNTPYEVNPNTYGVLRVSKVSSALTLQEFFRYNSAEVWRRVYANSQWYAWVRTDSGGSLPLSGGTVTGATTFNSTLNVSGTATMGRINASNEYLTGSLYVGGKSSTSDGKPGVAFGASGNITMQSTSTAKINFINGTNTSAKAYIASGSSNDISVVAPGYIALMLDNTNQVRLIPANSDTITTYFYPSNDTKCSLGSASNRWYRLYQSYSSVSTSDKRQKENIKALKNVRKHRKKKDGTIEEVDVYAELFDRLNPVEYNFIDGEKRKDFGLIAQDVLEVMTELGLEEDALDLVHHDTWIDEKTGEKKDAYGIAYENLIAVLIHEVQKLKEKVK